MTALLEYLDLVLSDIGQANKAPGDVSIKVIISLFLFHFNKRFTSENIPNIGIINYIPCNICMRDL